MKPVVASDVTDIIRRDNRLPLPIGDFSLQAAEVGGGVGVVAGVLTLPLLAISSIMLLFTFVIFAGTAIATYTFVARLDHKDLTLLQRAWNLVETRIQPKQISDGDRDQQPDEVSEIITVWEPTHPDWFTALFLLDPPTE